MKLSICIPVFNNNELLKISLTEACKSIIFCNENDVVEIIVSDNASQISPYRIVEDVRMQFPTVQIVYNVNSTNLGMARNFLKVVEYSVGEFCWIIGSDDFIMRDSVQKILRVIDNFSEVDFINCGISHLDLNKIELNTIDDYIGALVRHEKNNQEQVIPNKLKNYINPKFNNVFLGSIMTGIFRREIWNSVDKTSIIKYEGFDTLASIYPHCYIYAVGFLNRLAIKIDCPLVFAGDGKRPWTTDGGNNYWDSSLPLIYYTILAKMLQRYKEYGLSKSAFNTCMNFISKDAGSLLLPIIFIQYIKKTQIKNFSSFELSRMLLFYLRYPNFYIGMILSIIRFIRHFWRVK